MPTRQGWMVLVAALTAVVIGRVFGVFELFLLGAGFAGIVVLATAVVSIRRPDLRLVRRLRPPLVAAGQAGRIELDIANTGTRRSPAATLTEPVGPSAGARLHLAPLKPRTALSVGYAVPTSRRGALQVGPLSLTTTDVLGLAARRVLVLGTDTVVITPRVHLVMMPTLGHGVLGRHLLAQAQRLGSGEFHSLRDYVAGDEPRSIHWRASARREELQVRQLTTEGVRRCLVMLDRNGSGEALERAVVAAASIVASAEHAGLTTRFVASGGADLRGPDVVAMTLRYLADVTTSTDAVAMSDRDPGEGLGLLVVITADPTSAAWADSARLLDPTETRVGVFTERCPSGRSLFAVDATSEDDLVRTWNLLAGSRRSREAAEPLAAARSAS